MLDPQTTAPDFGINETHNTVTISDSSSRSSSSIQPSAASVPPGGKLCLLPLHSTSGDYTTPPVTGTELLLSAARQTAEAGQRSDGMTRARQAGSQTEQRKWTRLSASSPCLPPSSGTFKKQTQQRDSWGSGRQIDEIVLYRPLLAVFVFADVL